MAIIVPKTCRSPHRDRPIRMMTMSRRLFTALPLGLLLTPMAMAAGNADEGKPLAYTCAGCHGIAEYRNAYPSYRVPKIAGQNEQYLVNALTGYKSGERSHPTMNAQASSFSEQDIANIAAYLAAQKN